MTVPQLATLPDGRRIAYAWSNPTSPRIILLCNSLCAPFATWDKVTARLEADGFSVLRYDQPGHGASDVPADIATTTFGSLASDVCSLLQSLTIDHLYGWVGVSMGAATGLYFATAYPGFVENLVVCDIISCSAAVAGTPDVFVPRVRAARQAGNMSQIVEQTIERWFSRDWRNSNPDELDRVRQVMKQTQVEGFAACCSALQSPTFDLRPLAGNVGKCVKNVLYVVGELDANLPQTMAQLRGETAKHSDSKVGLEVVAEAGHVCYIDGLDNFYQIVLGFLNKQRGNL